MYIGQSFTFVHTEIKHIIHIDAHKIKSKKKRNYIFKRKMFGIVIRTINNGLKKLSQNKVSVLLEGNGTRCFSRAATQKFDLSGIYPPIPTPFEENEDVAWKELQENLQKWENHRFSGYVVQGSNGEYVFLSQKERVEMVKVVRNSVSSSKVILAGSALEGTRETLSLTKEMADVGADAALVATPSFFKNRMNYDAMMKHYTTIANGSSIPIILYNIPSNTGIEFPLNAIFELAKHPNIIGLKDSGGNITNIGNIIERTSKEDFLVVAGSAGFLLPSMQLGAVGGVCALANILGKECCDLHTLILANDMDRARKLQLSLIAPNQAVTRKYNVPALKYAMDLLDYYGGPCRSPLTPLTEAEMIAVKTVFQGYL